MGDIRRQGSENITGGEVTSPAPHIVGVGEFIESQNLDPRNLRGAATRNGRAQHSTDIASDSSVDGLFAWERNNGTSFVVARVGTTFYDASTATWASIGIGGTSGSIFTAAPLEDKLCIVIDGLAPQKFTGTTLSALGGSPPSEAKFAVVHASKLWLAGDPENPQRKTFSATNAPEDFTTEDDAGSLTTATGGGDKIQGLATNKKVLITFYRNRTYYLTGNSTVNFAEERLIDRGLVSPTGHASAGDLVFFASDDAIYMIAGTRVTDVSTLKFKETYDAISDKSKISLGINGDLLLVVDHGADVAYAFAYKFNRWAKWTDQGWLVMHTANDQTFYAGVDGGSTTQIWKLDSGSLDGAATITANFRTPNLWFEAPDSIKNMVRVGLHAKPGLATTTVVFYKNGVDTGASTEMTFASTGDHDWTSKATPRKVRGHYLGIKAEWQGVGTVYGWAVYAEVTTDSGQIPVEN